MSEFLGAVILGLSFGSVYALLSVGLVLTYRTTGIFNLAFGPQAFFAAAVYYDTHVTHHWPMYLALAVLGRHRRAAASASSSTGCCSASSAPRARRRKLVSVLGLFVAIPQIMVFLWFGPNTQVRTRSASCPNGESHVQPARTTCS